MKKQKILIHSIAFSPDGVSTAYIYNDIALGFKDHGYEVVVLTTTPHYNALPEEIEKQPLKKFAFGLYYKSDFKGIPVYHVPQKKFKSFVARSIGFVYWHIVSTLIGLSQRGVSVILSPSPPLTIALVSILLAKCKGAKFIYNVQEIYPDFLINQGSLRSKPLVSLLKKMERFVYNKADRITTIDQVFYQTIAPRFRDPSKLVIIPNCVDTDLYKPLSSKQIVLNKEQFPDTMNLKVMYAGNIGHAQDWEPLLHAAEKLKRDPVEFWVIGEGVLKEDLQKDISTAGLTNIHLLPYQPRHTMASVINYADIHFIFMNQQMEGQGFPSKVYTIMACKKPLLVVSGSNTPLYRFLDDKHCSFLVSGADKNTKHVEIESILRSVSANKDQLDTMGNNGYNIVESKYSNRAVIGQYIQLVETIL